MPLSNKGWCKCKTLVVNSNVNFLDRAPEPATILFVYQHGLIPALVKRPLWAYTFALVASLLMLAIRASFHPLVHDRAPFSFFMLSCMATACFGGLGPGLFALVLGLVLGDLFFLPPYNQLGLSLPSDWILVAGYVIPSFFAILLFEALHGTRRKLEFTSGRLREELLERQKTEGALREAEKALRSHSEHLEEKVQERTAQLEETIDSLETLSYTVAHNLRAPLRALQGLSQAMLEDYSENMGAHGQDYLKRIRDSAVRMDALICDLLGYNRARGARDPLRSIPLGTAVEHAIANLEQQVRSSGGVITVAPDFPSVMASEAILVQAITIFLSNALKFVPPGEKPKIDITARHVDGMVRLEVRDHGIGIDPAHHQRIFGIFERLHEEHYPGNGIGLAIARIAIERLGGKTGVISALGEGSTFWFELPEGHVLPPGDEDQQARSDSPVG